MSLLFWILSVFHYTFKLQLQQARVRRMHQQRAEIKEDTEVRRTWPIHQKWQFWRKVKLQPQSQRSSNIYNWKINMLQTKYTTIPTSFFKTTWRNNNMTQKLNHVIIQPFSWNTVDLLVTWITYEDIWRNIYQLRYFFKIHVDLRHRSSRTSPTSTQSLDSRQVE